MKVMICIIFLCFLKLFFSQTCTNLVKNGDFESIPLLNEWKPFDDGTKTVINDLGNNVLRLYNPGAPRCGVNQNYEFLEATDDVLYMSYRVKLINIVGNALVAMDVRITYEDDDYMFYIGDLKVTEDDLGKWVDKKVYVIPKKKVKSLVIYLLQYNDVSEALYDDVNVCLLEKEYFVFDNKYAKLYISNIGQIGDLNYKGENQLTGISKSLMFIKFVDKSVADSSLIEKANNNNNQYVVSFFNSQIRITIQITTGRGYFIFEIMNVENPMNENIHYIRFFQIFPTNRKEVTAWAENITNSDLLIHAIPLSEMETCRYISSGYSCDIDYVNMDGFVGAKGALVAAPKIPYFKAQQNLIKIYNLPLMKVNNVWLKAKPLRESYLFAAVTPGNYENLLTFSKLGKFPVFLMISPLKFGMYNIPKHFNNITEFYKVMTKFVDAGIKLGIHTHMCRIDQKDELFHPRNIFKVEVGTLTGSIDNAVNNFVVNNDLDVDEVFQWYKVHCDLSTFYTEIFSFSIDDEIMKCEVSGNQLVSCTRGSIYTTSINHGAGTKVYFLPHCSGKLLDIHNDTLVSTVINSFTEVANRLKVNFIYADGSVHLPPYGQGDSQMGLAYTHRKCFNNFLRKIQHLEYTQFGGGRSSYSWYYCTRTASWDGVVYKNKEFTKNSKLPSVLSGSIYAQSYNEFGWWKINGAEFESGQWDYMATTFDDVHYTLSKTYLTERSVGLQLSSYHSDNAQIEELFKLVGRYHQLIKNDLFYDVFTKKFKKKYRQPDLEVELNSNYQFVEKKVVKEYSVWDSSSSYDFNFVNSYSDQKLRVIITPKIDYYGFNDVRHVTISNFQTSSTFVKSVSSSSVTCTVQNNGIIDVDNSANNNVGGCKLKNIAGTNFDLLFKRGIGLRMTGDNSGSIVMIHVNDHDAQWGYRDYRIDVNFNGQKDFLLGNAVTDMYVYFNKTANIKSNWGYSHARSSWNFDWKKCKVDILVFVEPRKSTHLTFHLLKGLTEKPNTLVSPTLKINNQEITFPETLYHNNNSAAYLLDYNGVDGSYSLYTPNLKLLHKKTLNGNHILIKNGLNSGSITSDTSDSEFSTRGEVSITLHGETFKPFFMGYVITSVSIVFALLFCICLLILIAVIMYCSFKKRKLSYSQELKHDYEKDY